MKSYMVCDIASKVLLQAEAIDDYGKLTADEKLVVLKTMVSVMENIILTGTMMETAKRSLELIGR